MPTPEEVMFGEAVSAVQAGQRARALDLMTRLIKTRPENAEYWIWMSAVVSTPKERVYCLKEALRFDPQNIAAQRGLILAGALPPNPDLILPAAVQKRDWQSKILEGSDTAGKRISARQYLMLAAAAVVVIGLVSVALFSTYVQPRRRAGRPMFFLPTGTAVLSGEATAAPNAGTPEPLAISIKETVMPTPLYVNTPHTASEAYRIALRAYQRGEWEPALSYFQQALEAEPGAADILYYIGETYRQQGELDLALESFDAAQVEHPDFAPAYVGRARALLAQNPADTKAAQAALDAAISEDPGLGEAYLEMAALQMALEDPQAALKTLQFAGERLPESALVFVYRAEAYLLLDRPSLALQNARRANQMDPGLLPAYRMIAAALQASGDLRGSIEPLSLYLNYTPEDAQAWILLASAQRETGDAAAALRSVKKAVALDESAVEARMLYGQLLLDDDRAEEALAEYEAVLRADDQSFAANMGSAQALIALKYPGDAYQQIESAKRLAFSPSQKAEWTYWRARSLDALGEVKIALKDYRALVALPEGDADAEWVSYAQKRIAALDKSTPTPTPVKTKTPQPTPTRPKN